VAWRREQREQLEIKHRENRATSRKVRPLADVTSTAYRPFGTNSLKEEALWRIDPLLSDDTVNTNRFWATAR
jgi:hypothetical protein